MKAFTRFNTVLYSLILPQLIQNLVRCIASINLMARYFNFAVFVRFSDAELYST
jgi:hypothetical protein